MPSLTRRSMLAGLALTAAPARATEPVTLLIPFAAGGATDRLGRMIAPVLARALDAPVTVEVMPGETGQRAMRHLMAQPADGRTLIIGNPALFAFNPHLFAQLAYDPLADLAPIGLIATNPMVLLASATSGITDVAALRRRAQQGPLTIGSAGRGSALFMGGVMLMRALGDGGELVTYPGGGPALEDLQSGLLDVMVDQAITAIPATHLGARAIAVLHPHRLPELATVPTAAEAGLTLPNLAIWNILALRAGTPEPLIQRMARALEASLGDEMLARSLAADSVITPEGTEHGPAAAAALIRAEHARWGSFIRTARLQ
ncbi:Bug family tripartite tricarboxylate transporter substrate binding protein [Roseococcus sp. SDR]|uniref:Bug family tripartite tricarboxylate transporter substrate binding protein n=1 Tax=Roseococcus sp. SDR TaxID=2835532 RepID=UPI0035302223